MKRLGDCLLVVLAQPAVLATAQRASLSGEELLEKSIVHHDPRGLVHTVSGSVRMPRVRSWYTHRGDEFLGTDTLVVFERLP